MIYSRSSFVVHLIQHYFQVATEILISLRTRFVAALPWTRSAFSIITTETTHDTALLSMQRIGSHAFSFISVKRTCTIRTTSIAFPSSSRTFDTSGSGLECTSEVNLDPSLVPDCFGSVLISQSARVENTSHCHYCQEGWEVAAGMEYFGHYVYFIVGLLYL